MTYLKQQIAFFCIFPWIYRISHCAPVFQSPIYILIISSDHIHCTIYCMEVIFFIGCSLSKYSSLTAACCGISWFSCVFLPHPVTARIRIPAAINSLCFPAFFISVRPAFLDNFLMQDAPMSILIWIIIKRGALSKRGASPVLPADFECDRLIPSKFIPYHFSILLVHSLI